MDLDEGGVIVQSGFEFPLVIEVKQKKDKYPILLQLKNAVCKHKIELFSQEKGGSF